MATGFRWTAPAERAFNELADAYINAIHGGVAAIAQKWAPIIENWMKRNAPWTDRTANARQGLYTEVQECINQMVSIILAHGVDYGIYLEGWDPRNNREMKNAGRWAVVNPAIDYFAPRIWADVRRMLS